MAKLNLVPAKIGRSDTKATGMLVLALITTLQRLRQMF